MDTSSVAVVVTDLIPVMDGLARMEALLVIIQQTMEKQIAVQMLLCGLILGAVMVMGLSQLLGRR